METGEIIDSKYMIIRLIGKGAFSFCYLAKSLSEEEGEKDEDSPEIVLKITSKPEISFLSEYSISLELNASQNLLNYKQLGNFQITDVTSQETVKFEYMVSEFMPNGTLFDYVSNDGFNEDCARFIFKQVVKGIESMHESGYVHLDIKLGNILLDSNFSPKICDFGFAQRATKDHAFV